MVSKWEKKFARLWLYQRGNIVWHDPVNAMRILKCWQAQSLLTDPTQFICQQAVGLQLTHKRSVNQSEIQFWVYMHWRETRSVIYKTIHPKKWNSLLENFAENSNFPQKDCLRTRRLSILQCVKKRSRCIFKDQSELKILAEQVLGFRSCMPLENTQ